MTLIAGPYIRSTVLIHRRTGEFYRREADKHRDKAERADRLANEEFAAAKRMAEGTDMECADGETLAGSVTSNSERGS